MLTTSTPAAPAPSQGEAYADFVVRAHRELMPTVSEPTDRNQLVWQAWSAVHGDSEQARADLKFADSYQKRPDVCYFAEHEAQSTGPDGQPVVRRYDAAKLGEIIGENNLRIEDVDAYPTLIDRHTSPPGKPSTVDPETIGAIGPLRMGMIGRVNPRFAIFADEYVRSDAVDKATARPGRSVEVLTLRANGRTYINPVAAISEAPRLPLPLQFSFGGESDEIIERYSAAAPYSAAAVPAYPGGGNTHIEKFDSSSPDPIGDNSTSNAPQESEMHGQGQDQLVRQIVDAIMNTEQLQWVTQQMQSQGNPAGGAQPAAPPPQQFGAGGMQRYSAPEVDLDTDLIDSERYQALVDGQQQLVEELAASHSRIAQLEVSKADAERSSRLRELAGRMPINLEAELGKCLYSAGSSMDDEQFEFHLDTIETYAAKALEHAPAVPQGAMPTSQSPDRETARYQAQESALIRQLTNEYANQGVVKTYPELKAEAQDRLTAA